MSEAVQHNPTKKKWKRVVRKIIIWILILALLAGIGYYAYLKLKTEYTVTYDTYQATIGTISNSLSFSGSLQLIDSAYYSASSEATVRNVYVAVGDNVVKGQKLLRLSSGETIEAEFDGRVNQLNVEKDDSVTMGTSLIQVADFEHLRVSIRIDEYDIGDVEVGESCVVTTTATEKKYESKIDNINYISSSGGNVAYYTGTLYVDVAPEDGVYPGMQVSVTIPQEEARDVVILKMDALSFDKSNSAYVWMKDEAGELKQVSVTVGVSNGNYVEIKEGLNDGDTVYVEVETTTSAVGGLFSGLFGGTQFNGMSGNMPSGGFGGGNMPDFSSFDPSSMPSGFGGGSSGGSGNSGSSGSSGSSGGFSGGGMGGGMGGGGGR